MTNPIEPSLAPGSAAPAVEAPSPDAVDIAAARRDIYLGRGYHIVRGFLHQAQVAHLLRFWRSHSNKNVPNFSKHRDVFENCPDYTVNSEALIRHYNFFWNRPLDPFTYHTAWRMQSLRNRIEGVPAGHEYLPLAKGIPLRRGGEKVFRAASYRMVFTRQGGEVAPHVDYSLDHSRVQLSLNLSRYGEDYSEGGFLFHDSFRGGFPFNLGRDEELQPGDLVLFRYGQKHGVEAVATPDGGAGYCRMLMPQEVVPRGNAAERALRRTRKKLDKLKARGQSAARAGAESEELYYDDEIAQYMQLALSHGFEPAEVFYYKGLWGRWKEHQQWQYDVLLQHGLQPQHQFLDLGCGFGRLAVKLVPWLESGRYCGIDALAKYIELAEATLDAAPGPAKEYQLVCDDNFDFGRFGRKFDFAMAQSVFTHLSFAQIEECLARLQPHMNAGGQLLFTIILGCDSEKSFVYAYDWPMTYSTHRDTGFYHQLGRKYGFSFEEIGAQGHASQVLCRAVF